MRHDASEAEYPRVMGAARERVASGVTSLE
jgi:hypothetical protein